MSEKSKVESLKSEVGTKTEGVAGGSARLVRPGPRTFDHFPEAMVCPVCGTNDDGLCVLVAIDGTQDGNIAEAAPTHLVCAVGDHLSMRAKLIYRQVDPAWTYPPKH